MAPPDPVEARSFTSPAVSIDILAVVRRRAAVATVASVVLSPVLVWVLDWKALGVIVATLALWIVAMALPRWRRAGPERGSLCIEGDTVVVRVDRVERRLSRGSIVSGYRTDDDVHLGTRQGEVVTIVVKHPEEGEAVLRALGYDARQSTLDVPVASIASRVPLLSVFVGGMLLLQIPGVLFFPC
jgi:hypothetical protein